jgi:molecular chaperone DnaK (HSP70)
MKLQLSAVNPDEAVALGAAVQAGVLEGTVAEGEVVDVWQAQLMRALATARLREQGTLEQTLDGDGEAQMLLGDAAHEVGARG